MNAVITINRFESQRKNVYHGFIEEKGVTLMGGGFIPENFYINVVMQISLFLSDGIPYVVK